LAPDISSFIMENGSRYFHTIVRSKSAIENPIEAETVRINTTLVFIKEPLKLALPQGLGWRNHIERVQSLFSDYGIRSTMDSSIFYCVYHFGLVLGLVFLFYILCYFIGLLIRIKELNRLIDFMAEIVFFLAFIILFFLKSWMFTYLNVSIVYSLLILMIRYPDIYIELRKN